MKKLHCKGAQLFQILLQGEKIVLPTKTMPSIWFQMRRYSTCTCTVNAPVMSFAHLRLTRAWATILFLAVVFWTAFNRLGASLAMVFPLSHLFVQNRVDSPFPIDVTTAISNIAHILVYLDW